MRSIDYDREQYRDYARGRALTREQLGAWIGAFAALLPEHRPLAGLDVGSGTGRFTPALAEAFGPVTGVEPSVRMREVAEAQPRHPGVRYLAGSAEDLPVPSASADYALMFLSWHHVQDKPRAVRELARVLMASPAVQGVALTKDGLEVRASDHGTFTRALAGCCRAAGIGLREVIPSDESLESVFAYLVGA